MTEQEAAAESIALLYCTTETVEEAQRVAEAVVQQRLAACANILPGMCSVFHWEGRIERGEEAILILKTRRSLIERATEAVKRAHSYSVPCVLPLATLPGGNMDYVQWLLDETAKTP